MCRDRALFSFLRGKKKKQQKGHVQVFDHIKKWIDPRQTHCFITNRTPSITALQDTSLLSCNICSCFKSKKKKKNEAICLSSGYKNETLCVIIVVSVCIIFKWLSMLPLIAFQLLTEWKKTQHTFWRPSKQHWTQIPTHNFMDSSLTLLPKIKTSEVKTWMGKHLWQKCLTKDTILVQ